MKVLNEENIISSFKRGNKKSFRVIYDMLFSPLHAFAGKFLIETLLTEDVVQESFLALWNKREDFHNLPTIRSFLYTSVRNSCLNHLKHKSVERKHEKSLSSALESNHYYQNAVIEEETFNLLYSEIKNLPDSTQGIMLLALNGLKNPEIAEEMGISVNTVKTLKKHAYSKLRLKLSSSINHFLFFFIF